MKKNRLLFLLYGSVMLWLLFGQRLEGWGAENYADALRQRINLIPFDTINRFWWVLTNSHERGKLVHAFINLAGNVVMFVPLGLLLPKLFAPLRRFWMYLGVLLCLLVTVELLQLVTLLGSCDVDDLILNLAGGIFGYVLWWIWEKFHKNDTK